MNILSAVLGPVTNLAGTWMKNKHEQSQAKHQAKMTVIQNDANWEDKMALSNWYDMLLNAIISTTQQQVKLEN